MSHPLLATEMEGLLEAERHNTTRLTTSAQQLEGRLKVKQAANAALKTTVENMQELIEAEQHNTTRLTAQARVLEGRLKASREANSNLEATNKHFQELLEAEQRKTTRLNAQAEQLEGRLVLQEAASAGREQGTEHNASRKRRRVRDSTTDLTIDLTLDSDDPTADLLQQLRDLTGRDLSPTQEETQPTRTPGMPVSLPGKPSTNGLKAPEMDMVHRLHIKSATGKELRDLDPALSLSFAEFFYSNLRLNVPTRRKRWGEITRNANNHVFATIKVCLAMHLAHVKDGSTWRTKPTPGQYACDYCTERGFLCARIDKMRDEIFVRWLAPFGRKGDCDHNDLAAYWLKRTT